MGRGKWEVFFFSFSFSFFFSFCEGIYLLRYCCEISRMEMIWGVAVEWGHLERLSVRNWWSNFYSFLFCPSRYTTLRCLKVSCASSQRRCCFILLRSIARTCARREPPPFRAQFKSTLEFVNLSLSAVYFCRCDKYPRGSKYYSSWREAAKMYHNIGRIVPITRSFAGAVLEVVLD